MSLYAKYMKEREGVDTLEREDGFATYIFRQHDCYIIDIYVVPEKRKSGLASEMADEISKMAKEKGYRILTGSVDTRLPSAGTSEKVLTSYGFREAGIKFPMKYFYKELI